MLSLKILNFCIFANISGADILFQIGKSINIIKENVQTMYNWKPLRYNYVYCLFRFIGYFYLYVIRCVANPNTCRLMLFKILKARIKKIPSKMMKFKPKALISFDFPIISLSLKQIEENEVADDCRKICTWKGRGAMIINQIV